MSAFVIASSKYGPMLINTFDTGVGWQILTQGSHEDWTVEFGIKLATECYHRKGRGVRILDVGANIGANTVAWAKHMKGWGEVVAYEPQETVFYTLAGNIVLNNLMNAKAKHGAVAYYSGSMKIPQLNHNIRCNFGGLGLKEGLTEEGPGQPVSYKEEHMADVPVYHLDGEGFDRVDILKIDVEGMEFDVLEGASNLIWSHYPVIIAEYINCGKEMIQGFLMEYDFFELGGNLVCVHQDQDEMLAFVKANLP